MDPGPPITCPRCPPGSAVIEEGWRASVGPYLTPCICLAAFQELTFITKNWYLLTGALQKSLGRTGIERPHSRDMMASRAEMS